ncbi:BTB/POZ domain-containing protein [Candidatus Protochlamydia sp. R18]|uniref:BTB/POZ domain-containing protein n=1 Tax=Candidatus Protochlamydia sp. R18 TaxID=1353977 RepID=UPI0009ABCC0F|nr:BTB/POZ domain-containing protein [Candidatus Protochlamydia sp. R18]
MVILITYYNNPISKHNSLTTNTNTCSSHKSNNYLKFSERINLLCTTIFQCFLNLFFNCITRDQLQSQWREVFWGRKETVNRKFMEHRLSSDPTSLSLKQISRYTPTSIGRFTQNIINSPKVENKLLRNSSVTLEETDGSTIPSSNLFPLPQEFKLSFQNNTFLTISSSQKSLLMEKSPYFRSLWSGNFKETFQHPLALSQKEFNCLINCLLDASFKVPVEDITSFIQLADYYQLTDVVKNLEKQLLDAYKSDKCELFNSSEDNLVELKEILDFAERFQLNILKNYLQLTVMNLLLKQTPHLKEFEKILNYFSNEIEGLNFSENVYLTDAHLLALKNCKNLKVLQLQSCHHLTDNGLACLPSLTNLQYLNLNGCKKLTDAGLAHLTPLVTLRYLDLGFCDKLTSKGLGHFKSLIALQHLNLSGCKFISDTGLAHLTPLVALQHLNLSQCTFLTDAGLAHLVPLVALKHLDLSWCNSLTNAGLAHLVHLVALQYLNLSGCIYLSEAGLAHLAPLTSLQHLNLEGCEHFTNARFRLAHFKASLAATN